MLSYIVCGLGAIFVFGDSSVTWACSSRGVTCCWSTGSPSRGVGPCRDMGPRTQDRPGLGGPMPRGCSVAGCVGSSLLGEGEFQAQGPCLGGKWRLKDYQHCDPAFPNTGHEEFPDFWIVCAAAILLAASRSPTVFKFSCVFDKPRWSVYL